MPNIRPLESISVQGLYIPPLSSVLLKPCKAIKSIKNGFIRAHNVSNVVQVLMPSAKAQKQWAEFSPKIKGDSKPPAMPMAWNNPSIRFEIISLPDSILPSGDRILINASKYTKRGTTWTMKELVSAVKAPDGSPPPGPKNPGNYMGYDRHCWQEYKQETQTGIISNVDIIIVRGAIVQAYECKAGELAYIFKTLDKKMAFVTGGQPFQSYIPPDDNLRHFLDSIGTPGCISLLQKAIRRRPDQMRHPETQEIWPTTFVVTRIAQRFCRGVQQGYFLPIIGKYISGHQHFLKRLFIIAAEDSFCSYEEMFEISSYALLASLQPLWFPSEEICNRLTQLALNLLMTSVTTAYDTSQDWPREPDFQKSFPSRVHASIGGMQGDQRMLRWLELNPTAVGNVGALNLSLIPMTDPLDIYCDQHQDGRLVCLLPPYGTYSGTLSKAFELVTGFNTRRAPIKNKTIQQRAVYDALKASSKMLRGIVRTFPLINGPQIHYEVDEGAIAGMVGVIELRHNKSKFYVTVSSRDISKYIVIPKPTRDNRKGLQDITPELRDELIIQAKEKLRHGRRVFNPIEPSFIGKTIYFQDSGFWIDGKPWVVQKKRTYRLVVEPDFSKLHAVTTKNCSWSATFGAGHLFSIEAVQYALGRMAGYSPIISIPKINRVGKGTDESLTGSEAEAYKFLDYLSEYFPDAIWPSVTKPFAFESRCVAFRKIICKRLRLTISTTCYWPVWSSQLVLKTEQTLALAEMNTNWNHGLASFLWMLVGQGKTLTVLRHLEETRACKFIVWSLPKSAVKSVARQIKEVGWAPIQLYPSKSLLKKHANTDLVATVSTILNPMTVHLIEHDHLRSLKDRLVTQMSETAFVFDEVHKAMQKQTKRTAAALCLARIARQLIALTGTPIVDKSGYGLMKWLELCVPFPVSASNFWVAANSMISPLNTGDVITEDVIVQARESEEDKTFFNKNFPFRAPWHGQTQTPTAKQWIDMKTRTVTIVTNEIIRITMECMQRYNHNWRTEHFKACHAEKIPGNHWLQNNQRPLIVGSDQGHVVQIVKKLIQAGVSPGDIICFGGGRPMALDQSVKHEKTVDLSEQAVLDRKHPPYKIAVTAQRYNTGYSLTWMTCMITGSYPSNQAGRTQMRGRINRLDAQRLYKRYVTVLGGVTTITYRHQAAAKLMEDALRTSSVIHKKKKLKK